MIYLLNSDTMPSILDGGDSVTLTREQIAAYASLAEYQQGVRTKTKTRVVVISDRRTTRRAAIYNARVVKPNILNKVKLVKEGNVTNHPYSYISQYTYGDVFSKRGELIGAYRNIKYHSGANDIILNFD